MTVEAPSVVLLCDLEEARQGEGSMTLILMRYKDGGEELTEYQITTTKFSWLHGEICEVFELPRKNPFVVANGRERFTLHPGDSVNFLKRDGIKRGVAGIIPLMERDSYDAPIQNDGVGVQH